MTCVRDLDVQAASDADWSPDGTSIVTAHIDGSVRVFAADTGLLRFSLPGHGDRVNDVDWSPDGARIVTASYDGTAKVWSVRHDVARECSRSPRRPPGAASPRLRSRLTASASSRGMSSAGRRQMFHLCDIALVEQKT